MSIICTKKAVALKSSVLKILYKDVVYKANLSRGDVSIQ